VAVKNIIARGIGFTPSTSKWIVTHGFSSTAIIPGVALDIELRKSELMMKRIDSEMTIEVMKSEMTAGVA
jgi:hypothetical protein